MKIEPVSVGVKAAPSARKWDTAWGALRNASGVPSFWFHDLRHTVVTDLLEAGAAHQTCLNHLVSRARQLRQDHPRALLPGQIQEVLHDALAVRDRRAAGTISVHGAAVARGRLITRLSALLDTATSVPAIRRFMRHLDREWSALFSFLFDVQIDATNWRAEHAMRWAVVTRNMCGGGNRQPRGAVTQYVLASVLRTAWQRGLDRCAVLTALLRSPTPIVSPDLQPRAGPH